MRYIGNDIFRERIYLDRQPKVGDRVEYVYDGYSAEFPIESEGTIVDVHADIPCVLKVEMDRSDEIVSYIHEEWVAIYEDRYYKST